MGSGSGIPGIFPSSDSIFRRPLPSTGSHRSGSPASPVLPDAPTSNRPSRRTSSPSLGGTLPASDVSCLPRWSDATAAGLELVTGDPHPAFGDWRRLDLPGSWETPMRTCHVLGPRWDLYARSLRRLGAAFQRFETVGSHDVFPVEAQWRGPSARCLRFAAGVAPGLAQDSLPAADQLCRAGLVTRWVSLKGFWSSRPPFPDFAWRTETVG